MRLNPLPPEEDWIIRRFATIEQSVKESAFNVLNSAPMAKWVNTAETAIGWTSGPTDWYNIGSFSAPRMSTGYGMLIIGLAASAYQLPRDGDGVDDHNVRLEWQLTRNGTAMTSGLMMPGIGGGASGPVGGLALSTLSDPATYLMRVKRIATGRHITCNPGMMVGVPVRLS